MFIYSLILLVFLFFVIMTVFEQDVMKASMYFALSSVMLSVIFYFKYSATYAAAFQLSICAGLITVLFMAGVTLVSIQPKEDK